MTDQFKRKLPRLHLTTSVLSPHFGPLHFHGSLTLTSMQHRFNAGSSAEKFNITSYIHILAHFLTDKNYSTQAYTKWQFSRKTAQVLNPILSSLKLCGYEFFENRA